MRTPLAWMLAIATLAGLSFGQSANPRQSLNPNQATTKAPASSCITQGGWNGVESCMGSGFVTSNSIVDATVFPGAPDACAQINAALLALPQPFGGTVDARGLTGNLKCMSNPWVGFAGGGTLLLGAATYEITTNTPWVIPNKSRMFGVGRGDTNSLNTNIEWTFGNPTGPTPVIDFGSGFGIFVGNLSVDCQGNTNLIGIRNQNAQEQSGVDHLLIKNCSRNGLDVEGNGSQNSGPYTNLEVAYQSGCLSSTIPVNFSGPNTRGINGLTITADGISCSQPAAGVDVNGSSNSFEHVHCENVGDCIRVGNAALTHDTVMSEIEGCPSAHPCNNVIHICGTTTTTTTCSGNGGATEVVVDAVAANNGTGVAILQDDVTQTTIPTTDENLGLYVLGRGAVPTLISTSAVGTSLFNSHLGTGNSDTAGTCTLSAGSCTVRFATAYRSAPVCTANSTGSKNALKVSPSVSSLGITSSSSTDTSAVGYICIGVPD